MISMELVGKKMPHNVEIEQSLIGAMILDSNQIVDVSEILRPEDFYKEAHKKIYEIMLNMYRHNEAFDIMILKDKLETAGMLEEIGGITYLSKLTDEGSLITNVSHYSKIIEEKSILRRLIKASSDVVTKGYEAEDANELLDIAERNIFDISQKKNRESFSGIKVILDETYDQIEELAELEGRLRGLPTGFEKIDQMTSGFQKSNLILIAARPSMGKTALAINICQNIGIKTDSNIAIFSLEMSKQQLVQRMICSEGLIEMDKIRTGNLNEDDWLNLTKASAKLSNANIFIDDTPGINLMEMRAKARRLKMQHGLDVIMIDYLQLMSSVDKHQNRQNEISAISRGLKGLAREIDCPVIALSQLSRAPEQRSDHRPILSDLRDSGAIEQDADLVMFLYRDEYYNEDSEDKGIGEIKIAKQRNGETGTVKLAWLGKYTKFVNRSSEDGNDFYG